MSVNPGLPGASSFFAATESCVVFMLSWVVCWQSSEMSRPFDPLMLNMTVVALCSYHFSDFGVGDRWVRVKYRVAVCHRSATLAVKANPGHPETFLANRALVKLKL